MDPFYQALAILALSGVLTLAAHWIVRKFDN